MNVGVVVTGPPRSGTSAVTRLLDLAGLAVCTRADRVGGGPNNPTGHWESRSVLAINNRLLDAAGTRWWCPPAPGVPIGGDEHEAARVAFRAAHPVSPWVGKDPRFAFTLPFWREALDDVSAAVVVVRRPDEVVASLRRTWPLSVEHAGALWVRYLYGALVTTVGLPVNIVRFPDVLSDVDGALAPLAAVLAPLGVALTSPDRDDLDRFVRAPAGTTEDRLATPIWELWDQLSTSRAMTPRPEDPWVEAVLAPLRDDLRAGRPIDTRPVFAVAGDPIG